MHRTYTRILGASLTIVLLHGGVLSATVNEETFEGAGFSEIGHCSPGPQGRELADPRHFEQDVSAKYTRPCHPEK